MTKINMKFQAGEVIVLTEGEYSDFGITGFLVAIKDFDMAEYAKQNAQIKRKETYGSDTSGFAGFLVASEVAVPVSYRDVHLGSYGDFEDDFGVPKKED